VTTTIDRQQLAADVDALRSALLALPHSDALEKAGYHCERLAQAIRSSHSEATRFAAFTVLKILRDRGAELPADLAVRARAIRAALEASGFDLSK
jgi:hypothetical protein